MENYNAIFESHLRLKQLKFTEQRSRILEGIFDLHEHFTVESLYDYLKEKGVSDVSIPTIYRTLPLLVECGLVKIVDVLHGRECYEHTYGHPKHIHITCTSCGLIIEDENTKNIYSQIKKISDVYDFRIDDFNLSIKGKCHECRKSK